MHASDAIQRGATGAPIGPSGKRSVPPTCCFATLRRVLSVFAGVRRFSPAATTIRSVFAGHRATGTTIRSRRRAIRCRSTSISRRCTGHCSETRRPFRPDTSILLGATPISSARRHLFVRRARLFYHRTSIASGSPCFRRWVRVILRPSADVSRFAMAFPGVCIVIRGSDR